MKLFLTVIITLAILAIAIRFGDFFIALYLILFWGIVLLLITGLVALVVWGLLS